MAITAWEYPVGEALAAKWKSDFEGIRSTSVFATSNLPTLPGLLVLPPDSRVTKRTGNMEEWEATYPCYVIVSKKDPRRSLAELTALLSAARMAWWDGITLGLDNVSESYMVSYSFDPEELAGLVDLPAYRTEILVKIVETRGAPRTA